MHYLSTRLLIVSCSVIFGLALVSCYSHTRLHYYPELADLISADSMDVRLMMNGWEFDPPADAWYYPTVDLKLKKGIDTAYLKEVVSSYAIDSCRLLLPTDSTPRTRQIDTVYYERYGRCRLVFEPVKLGDSAHSVEMTVYYRRESEDATFGETRKWSARVLRHTERLESCCAPDFMIEESKADRRKLDEKYGGDSLTVR